jgi:hypothetical protein
MDYGAFQKVAVTETNELSSAGDYRAHELSTVQLAAELREI